MAIEIGQQAPAFSLYDSEKNKVSLSDFKGKNVLLLFYPQAFTSTCTRELCGIRDNIGKYEHANAQVIGISVDSVYTLAQYKASQNFNFPLLSDFNKEMSKEYDTIYDNWNYDMKGVSKRSAFIIDRQGIIQYAEVLEDAKKEPDYAAIEKKLSILQ